MTPALRFVLYASNFGSLMETRARDVSYLSANSLYCSVLNFISLVIPMRVPFVEHGQEIPTRLIQT